MVKAYRVYLHQINSERAEHIWWYLREPSKGDNLVWALNGFVKPKGLNAR